MVMKIWEFEHKMGYNSAYIRVMAKNLALNGVFSRSHNGLIEIYHKQCGTYCWYNKLHSY